LLVLWKLLFVNPNRICFYEELVKGRRNEEEEVGGRSERARKEGRRMRVEGGGGGGRKEEGGRREGVGRGKLYPTRTKGKFSTVTSLTFKTSSKYFGKSSKDCLSVNEKVKKTPSALLN
jgi:hypothetical protein